MFGRGVCNLLFSLKSVPKSSLYHVVLTTVFTGKHISLDLAEKFSCYSEENDFHQKQRIVK